MLQNFTPRLYQETILATAAKNNTLVVLPTGLGKTALAFLLAAQRLSHYPQSKILMLAPTKPLCDQHAESFRKHLTLHPEKIVIFTGSINPEKRQKLWIDAQIIISTPQGLENDVINQRINLKDVSLLIFDEAHHATGEYAYVWLADQYDKVCSYPRILGLTASPGSDLEDIKKICMNLKIKKVEVRTEDDPDVKPYMQQIHTKWLKVEFPQEFKVIQKYLQETIKTKLTEVQKNGYVSSLHLTKSELLLLQLELQKKATSGEHDFSLLRSISLIAEALKAEHALELLETQGIKPLDNYFHRMQEEAKTTTTKALKNLVLDSNFKSAVYLTEELIKQNVTHPKITLLHQLVQEEIINNQSAKIIIFTQFRDSAEEIVKALSNIKNHIFVGQSKKNGLGFSQKQQKEILDQFRGGEFNVLIATSVAEEGLDIPKVDKVIFYEPVPSAIRSIQRRGRTGRLEKGEVTILTTNGTRDEAYRWSSHHKEKRMYRNLDKIKKEFSLTKEDIAIKENKTKTLNQYLAPNPIITILADYREKDNHVVKELIDLGISVKTTKLESADYILSGKVGVELKKVPDFVASIIDGRLIEQTKELKKNFENAVLIIEGEEDIYTVRNVHPNAIRGMLATIALGFHIPILYTKNSKDTASMLSLMAKREQEKDSDFTHHYLKPKTMEEQLEFFVSSLPNIGPKTAKILLTHFGSIKNITNATKEQLMAIEGIGSKTALLLIEMFEKEYKK